MNVCWINGGKVVAEGNLSSIGFIITTNKVVPVDTKSYKLKCSNYRQTSFLSNIDKILDRLMYNHIYRFLEWTVSFTFCNLVLDKTFSISCFNSFNWQNKRATRLWNFCLWNMCGSPESFWHSRPWHLYSQIESLCHKKRS